MGIIQEKKKDIIVLSKIVLWKQVISLLFLYLVCDTIDTTMCFQKNAFSFWNCFIKICSFKYYFQQAKHTSNFILTV